jgi:hypothetical protein
MRPRRDDAKNLSCFPYCRRRDRAHHARVNAPPELSPRNRARLLMTVLFILVTTPLLLSYAIAEMYWPAGLSPPLVSVLTRMSGFAGLPVAGFTCGFLIARLQRGGKGMGLAGRTVAWGLLLTPLLGFASVALSQLWH